jgi:subtilisin family serine protease
MLKYLNFLVFFTFATNRDEYSWSLDRINQNYIIPDFHYPYTDFGQNITVYVIDSGFTNNTKFYDNIIISKSFIDDDPQDFDGHGTHVISLISSKYGISDNVNIVSLKVFNSTHESNQFHLTDALNFTKEHCSTHSNKCIINLSLGFDDIVEDIDILLADLYYNHSFIIVASSGNENIDACERSPGHSDFVITVGSIDYFDFKSSFSNFGDCVDIYTYGELIIGLNLDNSVILKSGTSMSAPIISGFVANLWSKNPNLNNFQLTEKFYDNYIIHKNKLDVLYTSENQYNLLFIFIPIFSSFIFFKILLIFCCCKP